jgi:hypothetical protein
MNILQRVVSALCATALAAAPIAAPAFAVPVPASADEPWTVVPEETLRDMRGGIDLGALVANFAIMRVVEVDGVVVARMQIVISNLDRLGNGGMPTISLSGPSAELVQIMNAAGNPGGVAGGALNTPASGAAANTGTSAPAANTGTSAAAANIAPAAAPAVAAARSGSGTTASTPQVASTTGNAGTVSATNTQTGSMAQFGSALTSAVTAANGGAVQPGGSVAAPGTSSSSAAPTPAASGPPASVAQNTMPQSSTSPEKSTAPQSSTALQTSTASSAAAPAAGTTQIVPLGSTGQVAVLSNLPNATALTTAIQNNVRAATIQVQTTISATLNSLALLNASSLASSIRQQVSKGP